MTRKISKGEFKEVLSSLYSKGVRRERLNEIEGVFRGDLDESGFTSQGIDEKELDEAMKWFNENKSKHNISDKHLALLDEEIRKKL